MDLKGFFNENLAGAADGNVDRGYYGNGGMNSMMMNPFGGYQQPATFNNQYSTPYQFPASGSSGSNLFAFNGGTFDSAIHGAPNPLHHSFGLKFGDEQSGYGQTAVGTQTHYGPPVMQSKGGKLKGAALSALTLLMFLFFLNLLQSCLKDQMDVMNPTVMVMSAGQRNARTEEISVELNGNKYDDEADVGGAALDEDYEELTNDYNKQQHRQHDATTSKSRLRIRARNRSAGQKRRRHKSKAQAATSTIGPKLQNFVLLHSETAS